jgi:2-amino-4-hydroxy-6-hydroxymethyldihydropteridine diphosphokinase
MILIAIGSNLGHPAHGSPHETCKAAVSAIQNTGCRVQSVSRWYRSVPIPASDQPDYVNGAVSLKTKLDPTGLMATLHDIENEFKRVRTAPNAARTLDLDLLVYGNIIREGPESPILPHPRMTERAFVLLPVRDIVSDWIHPVSGHSLNTFLRRIGDRQNCAPIN